MNIDCIHTSVCETNTYIIADNGRAIVVDPGGDAEHILSFAASNDLSIDYVLITHCHFDHVGAAFALSERGAKIAMSEVDYLLLKKCDFDFDLGFGGTRVTPFKLDIPLGDGDKLNLCGHEFDVLSAPGHTPGGLCFVMDGKYIFSGDTLFEGCVGRHDFPYCDEGALIGSVLKLFALDGDLTVLPGHGDATSLGREREYNAYSRYADISFDTELNDVAKLFFGDDVPDIYLADYGRKFDTVIADKHYRFNSENIANFIPEPNRQGRLRKIALYDALRAHTGREMPWGALTGVRPSKLFYECVDGGKSVADAKAVMRNVYRVEKKRANILEEIYNAQCGKLRFSDEYINLYIHIPYCATRCTYCSFVSAPIDKCKTQAEIYVGLLCDEIEKTLAFLELHGKKILSVYVGGGTPTALEPQQLDKILSVIARNSERADIEFTCEAGRPDTIDERKIDVMAKNCVTRVCVNPQTLNDATLERIGRRHTVDEFYKAYDIVARHDFIINCDLIAGLENEKLSDFVKSYNGILELAPQNITVHSLARKNGSMIRYDSFGSDDISAMTDHALDNLGAYRPYYLYRQKRQIGNLENLGFSLPGYECVNNITTMEETVGVMACGAGAISKAVKSGFIGRFAAMRDVSLYIERYEQKLKEKFEFFENAFVK